MKFRYAVFFIALCFVLSWSFFRIMNSGEINNNSNQMETKIDSMNTIDEIPVQKTEQEDESNMLDIKITDNAEEDGKAIEPIANNEGIIDEPDKNELAKKDSIDIAETVGKTYSKDKLWSAIN